MIDLMEYGENIDAVLSGEQEDEMLDSNAHEEEDFDPVARESADEALGDQDVANLEFVPVDDIIDLYLKEMAHVPLLTQKQEVELAVKLHEGREAQQALQENGRTEEERDRLQAVVDAGQQAREHLIRANTRLVVSVAKKYMNRGVPFLDLIQEGNIGLMKAVDRFDHTKGFRLSTYATWWIRQTVTRAIADQGRTIRMPVHMGDQLRRMYKVAQQLEQEFDRQPTPHEIANAMDIDVNRVRWMIDISRHSTSLQRPVGEDREMELGALIEDTNTPSPMETASEAMMQEQIERVLGTLTPREARILRMRFGLHDGRSYTLEEIGEKFGLTRERIRQLEGRALRRLRHPRRRRILREYQSW
jgi:RNA polymerase primary sigma factor